MKVENKAYIRIHDFECSIDEISNELKLNPSRSWIKGEKVPNRKSDIRRKQSTWEYQSTIDPTEPIEKHIDSLLDTFESKKDVFKKFSKKYYTELTLAIYEYKSCNPGFLLENKMLERISKLGLTLDVDIYVLLDQDQLSQ